MKYVRFGAVALAIAVSACQAQLPGGRLASDVAPPSGAREAAGTTDAVATASVSKESVEVSAYVPPAKGTVFTWRNNWTSLPPVISYRVDGTVRVGDTEYVKLTSVAGLKESVSAYYDTRNFSLKGYRDVKDKAIVTYKPAEERYRFPMKPGDKWVTAWKSWDHRKESETNGGGVVEVVGLEMIDLPAGRFKTVKVRLPTAAGMPADMRHYLWFSPELGVTVKEQIGNGRMNWTQILEKVQKPQG